MAVAGSLTYSTEVDNKGLTTGLKNAESQVTKTGGIIDVALGNIVANLTTVAVSGLKEITKAGIDYNAQMETYVTSFEVMLGSQEEAVAKMEELKKIGATTPFETADLADATQQLLAFGVSSDETTKYLMQLGDISGGSTDKLNSLVLAFGKMQSSGKVSLEYLNIMIERGFNPLNIVAEKTGESMEELYERVSDGAVSVEEIEDAIASATSEGGQFFQSMDKQSQTFAGQMSTLSDNVSVALGLMFEPLFDFLSSNVLPSINLMLGDVEGTMNSMMGGISAIFQGFTANIDLSGIIDGFINLKNSVEPVINTVGTGIEWLYNEILVPLFTTTVNDVLPVFFNHLATVFDILQGALTAVQPLLTALWDNFLQPIGSFAGDTIVALFTGINDALVAISENEIISTIFDGIKGFFTFITENEVAVTILQALAIALGLIYSPVILIAGAFAIWNAAMAIYNIVMGIGAVVTGAFGTAMAILTSPILLVILAITAVIAIIILLVKNWDWVKEKALEVWEKIKEIWSTVAEWINTYVVQPVIGFFQKLWDGIVAIFSVVAGWFKLFVIDPIVDRFMGLWQSITAIFDNIKGIFNGIIDFVKNVFSGNWRGAWDSIVQIFSNIIGGIANVFKLPINFIIDGINSFINGVNKIEIPDWVPLVGGKSLSIPKIPRLATGGVVKTSTLANIGEDGAEAVVPLENNTEWTSQVAKLMGQAFMDDKTFNSNANVGSSYNKIGKDVLEVEAPIVLNLDGEKIFNNQQKITFRKQLGGSY